MHAHLRSLDQILAQLAPHDRAVLAPLRAMLAVAAARGEGLYLRF